MGAAPYQFRSGVNAGGIAFAEDVRPAHARGEAVCLGRGQWGKAAKDLYAGSGYPRRLLEQAIAEARRTRRYAFGDFYPLSPITADPADWCVLQYHLPAEGDGMLIAFRRPKAPPLFQCGGLQGLDPEAGYLVTFAYSFAQSRPVRMSGTVLAALELKVDECPGSVLVEYLRAP
jgi:hypothetical protein